MKDGGRRWLDSGCRAATVLGLLLFSCVAAALTLPEFILYRDRLVVSLLEVESGVELQPFDLTTGDGLSLRSWYRAPQGGKPVLVYFPGRRGDLFGKPKHLFELADQGYGLLLAGYRGFGGNPGRPSENRLYGDTTALLGKLSDMGLAPDGVVFYGYSMGTGVASYAATQVRPRAIILEAPFTSFPEAVRHQASPVPTWLIRSRFDNHSRMRDVDVPVLLLAGEDDHITPPDFAEALAAISEGFSKLHILAGANHINMIALGAGEILSDFLFGLE